jgi:hypothetical protein
VDRLLDFFDEHEVLSLVLVLLFNVLVFFGAILGAALIIKWVFF